MQSRGKWRLAAIISPLVALGVATTIVACVDATRPATDAPDGSTGSAVVGLLVRSELTLLANGKPSVVRDTTHSTYVPVVYGFGSLRSPSMNSGARTKTRTVIRHFKERSGVTTSIGLYFDRPDAPPKLIYVFENGRIRAIVSPSFQRHGKGYVRTKAKLTLFSKEGIPFAQVSQSVGRSATIESRSASSRLAVATEAVQDVAQMFLPRQLHAQEVDAACFSQWVSYTATSVALAAAITALTAVAPVCISTGVGCAAAGAAFLAWTAALDEWNASLDKLAACLEANSRPNDDSVLPGGGGGGSGGGGAPWGDPNDPIEKIVAEFIDNAVASGNYWCSASGDHCVYYAS